MPDRAQMGRAAKRRGLDTQRRLFTWLRETGLFPAAEHYGQRRDGAAAGYGDGGGIGDRIAEVTVAPWSDVPAKLRQAEHDANERGFSQWFVWKPSRGMPAADSFVVFRARVIWPLLAELDDLRQVVGFERDRAGAAEERADQAWHRGYEAALKAHNLPYLVKGEVR